MDTLSELGRFLRGEREFVPPRVSVIDRALENINSINFPVANPNVQAQFGHQAVGNWFTPKYNSAPNSTVQAPAAEQVTQTSANSSASEEDLKNAIRVGQIREVIDGIHTELEQSSEPSVIDLSQLGDN